MRLLVVGLLALITAGAIAAEPGYSCKPERGCRQVEGPVYDIGGGASVQLPSGWTVFSYPTAPIPIMQGLREIRAFKDGMLIAISPFPNIDRRVVTDAFTCDLVSKGGSKYVNQSREKAVRPIAISHDELVGCQVSFSAENEGEKPFLVLPNRRHASVTSILIAYKFVIFTVSVVSESQPDDSYIAAVEAIRKMR